MAEGFSVNAANKALALLCGDEPWIQLHVGPPGADGRAHPARETRRRRCRFAQPFFGSIASAVELEWQITAAKEKYTHFTAWSSDRGGLFVFSGAVTAGDTDAGDTWAAGVGAFTASIPVAA